MQCHSDLIGDRDSAPWQSQHEQWARQPRLAQRFTQRSACSLAIGKRLIACDHGKSVSTHTVLRYAYQYLTRP